MKHTTIHTKKILAFAAMSSVLAALCLTGCQKNELSGDKDFNDGTIKYAVAVGQSAETISSDTKAVLSDAQTADGNVIVLSDKTGSISIPMECEVTDGIGRAVLTKGTLVNTTGSDKELQTYGIEEFPASAYNGTTPIFENKAIKYTAGTPGKWSTVDTYYWPQRTSLTFFAYANLPGEQTATINNTGVSTSHTVPATAAEQTDVLFGYYNGNGGNTGTAEIHFEHPLTAVCFKYGTIEGNPDIKSIELTGVAQAGTAGMSSNGTISWTGITSYGHAVSLSSETKLSVDETTKLIGEPFIIIPQQLAENNVKVKVTFIDGTAVEAVINSGVWQAGKTNTYTLKYENPWPYLILNVEGDISSDYQGGTKGLSITSDSPWKIQYTPDGGTTWLDVDPNTVIGDFVKFDKTSGTGSSGAQTVTATISAAGDPTEYTIDHTAILRAATPKGTEDAPYDLSMHTIYGVERAAGKPVTANCYVVNAPGWYAFPLVYGNAIKDGADNTPAYKNTGGSLGTFKKADDNNMDSPYISGVTSVYPLWEDVPNWGIISNNEAACYLISSETAQSKGLALGGSCGYVVFQVKKENLSQGNAVIAVKNASNILWSWHIWVTDDDLTCLTLGNGLHMMPENLGWVDEGKVTGHEGKSLQLRVVQMKGSEVMNEVDKNAERKAAVTKPSLGQSPSYQWGRKDPFIRALDMSGNKEIPSDKRSGEFISSNTANKSLSFSIKNPTSFISGSTASSGWAGSGGGGINNNLWSAANTLTTTSAKGYSSSPVKTVYDPCPPGFQVPQGNAFAGFSTSTAVGTFSEMKGFSFKLSAESSEFIYFPALGSRSYNGNGLNNVSTRGNYWTAVPGGSVSAYSRILHFQDNDVTPENTNNSRAYGFFVRPVAE